jgi:ornithine--oxo-acid transaminase
MSNIDSIQRRVSKKEQLMSRTDDIIDITTKFGASNYHPLPIVIASAKGVWVTDPEGNRYMDMLSAYSALNQGHCHPRIVAALKAQADKVTLTSRAFHNAELGYLYEIISNMTGKDLVLPMNSGAEAVETAIKAARKWGYTKKGISAEKAEIIVCSDNFHGRTTTIVGFSSEAAYKTGFGPFTPGFVTIPYGDSDALEAAITPDTCAFLVEPIQGEAGVVVPPQGYLRACREICAKHNVLMMADEIQTGFGRTGEMFCCDHEQVVPDVYILGKALSGGMLPVSAVTADAEVLDVFNPGEHGSTFGGSPLAAAVAREALQVVIDEKLPERSMTMGAKFMKALEEMDSPHVAQIRGKGLLLGVVLKAAAGPARPFCEKLMRAGLLCKETHERVIRFAPPLIISASELDWAIDKIRRVLV